MSVPVALMNFSGLAEAAFAYHACHHLCESIVCRTYLAHHELESVIIISCVTFLELLYDVYECSRAVEPGVYNSLRSKFSDCSPCRLSCTSLETHILETRDSVCTAMLRQHGTSVGDITHACLAQKDQTFTAKVCITVHWFLTACVVSTTDCYLRLVHHSCH